MKKRAKKNIITLEQFIEAGHYRFGMESGKWEWKCFGKNSWILEMQSKLCDKQLTWYPRHSANAIFDLETKEVYLVQAFVDQKGGMFKTAHHWINPKYRDAYFAEGDERGFPVDCYGDPMEVNGIKKFVEHGAESMLALVTKYIK